jgi:flagellar basal body rod protein FlgG
MSDESGQISSGLNALMEKYMAASNNIANVSTPGFKRTVTAFSTTLESVMRSNSGNSSDIPLTTPVESYQAIDFSQGEITPTGSPLDIALEGKGFLTLETSSGPLYTRSGSLDVNKIGQLIDRSGRLVLGQNGPIVISREVAVSDVQIGTDGVLKAGGVEIGKFKLVKFDDENTQLEAVGYGAYRAIDKDDAVPATNVKVRQGCRESSNVQMMSEMVSLMTVSRIYEMHINILKRQRENGSAALGVANS